MKFVTPKRAERVLLGFIAVMFIVVGGLTASLIHRSSHTPMERAQLWVIENSR